MTPLSSAPAWSFSGLRTHSKPVAFVIVCGVVSIFPALVAPAFLQLFIDEVIIARHYDWFRVLFIVLTGLMVVSALTTVLRYRVQWRWQRAVMAEIYRRGASWMFHHGGPMLSRGDRDAALARRLSIRGRQLPQAQITASVGILSFVLLAALLVLYSWLLASVTVTILLTILVFRHIRFNRSKDNLVRHAATAATRQLSLMAARPATFDTAGQSTNFDRWSYAYVQISAANQEYEAQAHTTLAWVLLLASLAHTTTLALGGWLVTRGAMSLGGLVAFQAILALMLDQFDSLSDAIDKIRDCYKDLNDGLCLSTCPHSSLSGSWPPHAAAPGMAAEVENLSATDTQGSGERVDAANLKVALGEHVALVGGYGLGLSCFARAICGEVALESGSLRLAMAPPGPPALRVERDDPFVYNTVEEVLEFAPGETRHDHKIRIARDFGLLDASSAGQIALSTRSVERLSDTQRRYLLLVRAVIAGPKMLVIDRLLDGLEPIDVSKIITALRLHADSVLYITEQVEVADAADRRIAAEKLVSAPAAKPVTSSVQKTVPLAEVHDET